MNITVSVMIYGDYFSTITEALSVTVLDSLTMPGVSVRVGDLAKNLVFDQINKAYEEMEKAKKNEAAE
jgi:hypothetical protein